MVAIKQIAAHPCAPHVATWRVLPSSDPNPGHSRSIRVPRWAPEAIARARYAQGKPSMRGRKIGLDLGALTLKSPIAERLQGTRPASSGIFRGTNALTYRYRHRCGSSKRASHRRSCTTNATGRRTCKNRLGGSGRTLGSWPCSGRASCTTSRSSPSTRSTSRCRHCGPSTWTTRPCAPPRSTTSWATSTRDPSSQHPKNGSNQTDGLPRRTCSTRRQRGANQQSQGTNAQPPRVAALFSISG